VDGVDFAIRAGRTVGGRRVGLRQVDMVRLVKRLNRREWPGRIGFAGEENRGDPGAACCRRPQRAIQMVFQGRRGEPEPTATGSGIAGPRYDRAHRMRGEALAARGNQVDGLEGLPAECSAAFHTALGWPDGRASRIARAIAVRARAWIHRRADCGHATVSVQGDPATARRF